MRERESTHVDLFADICFERGESLRVPEVVPFRMTPIVQQALGPGGLEGIFRTTAEHAMQLLREFCASILFHTCSLWLLYFLFISTSALLQSQGKFARHPQHARI